MLVQEGDRISTLLDHLDETAIWIVTETGEFGYISGGFEEVWGIPANAIRKNPERLIESIHPDDRDYVRSQITKSKEEISETRYEGRIIRPNGEVRWLKNQQIPVWDNNGNLTHVVGISTDITEQKRREKEYEVLNRILRHDIRNDMTVILGWMELLEDHIDDEGKEYLQKTLSAGNHIVELTDLAHDYVELLIEEDKMSVRSVPLASTLQTEINIRQEIHTEAEFVVSDEIPDVEVVANEMLTSVFRNLLNNAVQHNNKSDPEVTISFDTNATDVVVGVADNGPGIPDDQKESIFEEHDIGLESSGTGIGLYLVRTLVTDFGGEIWIEDNRPSGSIFKLQLPRSD